MTRTAGVGNHAGGSRTHPHEGRSTRKLTLWIVLALTAIALGGTAGILITRHTSDAAARQQALDMRIRGEVSTLLAGIPQEGDTLGRPTAPVTLQVFGDLECLTAKRWVLHLLPAIINEFVRPGIIKIQYRSLKTDTHNAAVFISQQAAALAAGEQDKTWTFVETFYHEQGKEYTPYVTERYLDGIASQVSGLKLARWHDERAAGNLSAQVVSDDHAARSFGMRDTPGFAIGRTGGKLKDFSGRIVFLEFAGFNMMRYPVALITTQDLKKAIKELV
jgi:protein-disulfide isomerase